MRVYPRGTEQPRLGDPSAPPTKIERYLRAEAKREREAKAQLVRRFGAGGSHHVTRAKKLIQAADLIASLQAEASKLRSAISWLDAPFVDENTPHDEVMKRRQLMLADVGRIATQDETVSEGARDETNPLQTKDTGQ